MKLAGGVTEANIAAWKEQYKNVFEIKVPTDDTGKNHAIGYFKKPDLDIIAASAKFAETDPIKSGIVVFDNCWLGGDETMKNDDECKISAISALNDLFKIRLAEVKNL